MCQAAALPHRQGHGCRNIRTAKQRSIAGAALAIRRRRLDRERDFESISSLLTRLYLPGNRDWNWLQPIWEYAYTHPWFDESALDRIGLWEDDGKLVAVATYESRLGEAFFNVHPGYAHLKVPMLDYAEQYLAAFEPAGGRYLKAYLNDFDEDFESAVAARCYREEPGSHRPMSQFEIPSPFPPIDLAHGFRLQSLADDNDLRKMDRVLHRGFDHPCEPPVATDPDYRRRGLGRAAVLEGIRRCGALGAAVVYVGTAMPFYLSIGFRRLFTLKCWRKRWGCSG